MKGIFSPTTGAGPLRMFNDPNAAFGDPYDIVVYVTIGDYGRSAHVDGLQGLPTHAGLSALIRELRRIGVSQVSWEHTNGHGLLKRIRRKIG